jgi:hypothetical protein
VLALIRVASSIVNVIKVAVRSDVCSVREIALLVLTPTAWCSSTPPYMNHSASTHPTRMQVSRRACASKTHNLCYAVSGCYILCVAYTHCSRAQAHSNSRRLLKKEGLGLDGEEPTGSPVLKGDLILEALVSDHCILYCCLLSTAAC